MRPSRRQPDELRPVSLERGVVKFAEGSCFVKFGETHVLVTATLEDRLPPWLKGQGRGWITAEYGMLPRATLERTRREASAGKQSGRTVEIQRLIGRSLRSVVDLKGLGERQITIDCDVIQADGGTRTASITGAWIALYDCLAWMKTRDMVAMEVLRDHIAAISCGVCGGTAVLDLDYAEDSQASPSWSTCRRWQSDDGRRTTEDRRRTTDNRPAANPSKNLSSVVCRPSSGYCHAQSRQACRDARAACTLRHRRHIGG